ncbi:MAG: helix-turn-helix domain-containing protein [Chitinophagales bacterium]
MTKKVIVKTYNHKVNFAQRKYFRMLRLEERKDIAPFNPHRHTFFELFFFTKGGGEHLIDFENYDIEDRSLHFVAPNQVHFVHRDLVSTGFVVLFSEGIFAEEEQPMIRNMILHLFYLNKTVPAINLSKQEYSAYLHVLNAMYQDYTQENKDILLLHHYLKILILKCQAFFEENIADKYKNNKALAFRFLLEEHFKTKKRVNEYADMLFISADYLNTLVKKQFTKTPSQMIKERISLEAKRLLLHSKMSCKEVAYALEFNDYSYFVKFFKKETGISPTKFRKSIAEKYHF